MNNTIKEIQTDDKHKLFSEKGMFYKEFQSDFRQIRYYTLRIVQMAPPEIKEINILEQQISELIKNAVRHGNNKDIEKTIKVWYYFDSSSARLIVEDEGEGFKDIDKWNEFHRNRQQCLDEHNFEKLADYVSYRTDSSDENDGGNALFAALEYWNDGVVFTQKANKIAVSKTFPVKRVGIPLQQEEALGAEGFERADL